MMVGTAGKVVFCTLLRCRHLDGERKRDGPALFDRGINLAGCAQRWSLRGRQERVGRRVLPTHQRYLRRPREGASPWTMRTTTTTSATPHRERGRSEATSPPAPRAHPNVT